MSKTLFYEEKENEFEEEPKKLFDPKDIINFQKSSKAKTNSEIKQILKKIEPEPIIKIPIEQINLEANIKKLNKLKKKAKKPKKNISQIPNIFMPPNPNFINNMQYNNNENQMNQRNQNKLNINVPPFRPKTQNQNPKDMNHQINSGYSGSPIFTKGRPYPNQQNFGNNIINNNNNGFNNINNGNNFNNNNNIFGNCNNINPILLQQLLNMNLNGNNDMNNMNNRNINQFNNNMMNNNINNYLMNLLSNMNNNNIQNNNSNPINLNLLSFLGNNLKNNQEEISIIRTIRENTDKGQKIYKLKYSTSLVKNNKNRKYQK